MYGSVIAFVVKSGGDSVIASSDKLLVPVLVMVTVCAPLVDPTLWLEKVNVLGLTVALAFAVSPVPLRGTSRWLPSFRVIMKLQL